MSDQIYETAEIFHNILRVGDLRRMLADVDAATQIVVDDNDGWWLNIARVAVPAPSGEGDYQCVSLTPGVPFDSRQM